MFSSAAMPHALASLVIITTVQAQDFQDAAGDAARGRRTLPLVFPRSSRIFTVFAIPAWSMALSAHSRLSPFVSSAFIALGVCVSACFTWQRTEASDRRAYVFYNVSPTSLCYEHWKGRLLMLVPYRYGCPSRRSFLYFDETYSLIVLNIH